MKLYGHTLEEMFPKLENPNHHVHRWFIHELLVPGFTGAAIGHAAQAHGLWKRNRVMNQEFLFVLTPFLSYKPTNMSHYNMKLKQPKIISKVGVWYRSIVMHFVRPLYYKPNGIADDLVNHRLFHENQQSFTRFYVCKCIQKQINREYYIQDEQRYAEEYR